MHQHDEEYEPLELTAEEVAASGTVGWFWMYKKLSSGEKLNKTIAKIKVGDGRTLVQRVNKGPTYLHVFNNSLTRFKRVSGSA